MENRSRLRQWPCLIAAALGVAVGWICPPQATAAPPTLQPEAAWTIEPALTDPDEATNLSGIACSVANGATRSCLLIPDETDSGRYARFVTLHQDHTIAPGRAIGLLPPKVDGRKMQETDVEGVAFADGFYYLAGSHGLKKEGGDFQPSRFFVYRFKVDAATGLPSFPFDKDAAAPQVERSGKLRALIAGTAPLKKDAERPLDEHGVNIEGLAVRDGRLFLGFRGPVRKGVAHVMSVEIEAIFGDATAHPKVFEIALGKGAGVRDLATVAGGFLILSGPEADETGPADLFFWNGKSREPARLASLAGLPEGAKPEAVLVLGEDAKAYRVLIFSDGIAGGAPSEYLVRKAS